jgi:hypothetical protein
MLKEELVDIMSDSVEETNRRHAISRGMPVEEYNEMIKWGRPAIDYIHEMMIEEFVRRGILTVD